MVPSLALLDGLLVDFRRSKFHVADPTYAYNSTATEHYRCIQRAAHTDTILAHDALHCKDMENRSIARILLFKTRACSNRARPIVAKTLQFSAYGSTTPAQFINCCAFYEFTKCAAQFINCANSQIAPNNWKLLLLLAVVPTLSCRAVCTMTWKLNEITVGNILL